MKDGLVLDMGTQLLRVLAVSGLFVTLALVHTGGLQGTGDTRSPFFISLVSQVAVPLGLCFVLQGPARSRRSASGPRSSSATRPARCCRSSASARASGAPSRSASPPPAPAETVPKDSVP